MTHKTDIYSAPQFLLIVSMLLLLGMGLQMQQARLASIAVLQKQAFRWITKRKSGMRHPYIVLGLKALQEASRVVRQPCKHSLGAASAFLCDI